MKSHNLKKIISACLFFVAVANAQNPIIHNQYTADPTARVFNGKVYLFPSHDIKAPLGKNLRKDWFCMADYHVFSSENLRDWTDHGTIVSQNNVPWVDSTSFSMWAPDCVERNGKFYFYFPANTQKVDENGRKGFGIGVAIADKPEGPYLPMPEPISNVKGIDPCVLIDKDGQAYLYWSQGHIFVAKLHQNMTELVSDPVIISDLPTKGLKEGPFVFERNGLYYLTFPHVENKIERLEYAVSSNPMGPYKMMGVIMDEAPNGCWTNHHSIVEYNNQWYLFYHQNDWSPKFDKNRSVRIDSLFFNPDGSIRKVVPTLRGVGATIATDKIQIDRFSNISDTGVSVEYCDTLNYFAGWKTIFNKKNSQVQYNNVDFGAGNHKWVDILYKSEQGATLIISENGRNVGNIKAPASANWKTSRFKIWSTHAGTTNITVTNASDNPIEIDWISFKF